MLVTPIENDPKANHIFGGDPVSEEETLYRSQAHFFWLNYTVRKLLYLEDETD